MADDLTATAFATEEGLDDWRYLLHSVDATFRAASPTAAAAFVVAVAELAAAAEVDADVDLRPPGIVHIALAAADRRVSTGTATVARAVSARAATEGLVAEPGRARVVEIAIDALDIAAVAPFWRAALGYDDDGPEALVDPLRIGPPVWFQQMDAIRPERNHIHIDITVPHDVAEARIAAVVAAGGRILHVEQRSFTVLADPEGNEACICTWQDRD
ncbi:MAG TPA: VOC family protein [Iamia sp.]|nr:VOC family protein [Iamia sp.]